MKLNGKWANRAAVREQLDSDHEERGHAAIMPRWIFQRKNAIVTDGAFTPCTRSMIPEEPSRMRRLLMSRIRRLSSISRLASHEMRDYIRCERAKCGKIISIAGVKADK